MADIKFSEFPKANQSKDSDEIAILQDGVNKMIPSPVLESKIINKTVSRVIQQGGASLNVINLKGVVPTYADLATITPTPELNDAYQVEADGLVYVYTENGFQADGDGFVVQPEPNGVVEEGNVNAVSGGEVFKSLSAYPYINDNLDPLLYTILGVNATAFPFIHGRFKSLEDLFVNRIYFDLSSNNMGFTKLSIYKSNDGLTYSSNDLISTQTISPIASSDIGNGYFYVNLLETELKSIYTYFFVFSGAGTFAPRTIQKSTFPGSLTGTFDAIRGNTELPPFTILNTHVYKPLVFSRVISAGNPTEVNDTLNIVASKIEKLDVLNGLKMAALGDSNTIGYPTGIKSYAQIAADALGMQLYNYGIVGSRLADLNNLGQANPMSERYVGMIDDADVVFVMGGTNDFRNSVPLGTINDTTNDTYYGALKVTAEGFINKYWTGKGVEGSKKTLFFIIPPKHNANSAVVNNQLTWRQAVIDVCRMYSLPYLDFYYLSTITPDLMRTQDGYNPFIPDAIHPSQEGHNRMGKVLAGFIKSLF